tara:strand:+ start:1114 stop:1518 length:405 start_codon:yes stop_codon:yes gene_type:complete
MAVKITVAKIVDGGDYAKQFAGHTTCVNCGNKQAVIINDTDDLVQNWRIECGECDHHIEDVEVEVGVAVSIDVSAYAYQQMGGTIPKKVWDEYQQTGDIMLVVVAVCAAKDSWETDWDHDDLNPEQANIVNEEE